MTSERALGLFCDVNTFRREAVIFLKSTDRPLTRSRIICAELECDAPFQEVILLSNEPTGLLNRVTGIRRNSFPAPRLTEPQDNDLEEYEIVSAH